MASEIEVICPCCKGRLVIDTATAMVVSHQPNSAPRSEATFDFAAEVEKVKNGAAEREKTFSRVVEEHHRHKEKLSRRFDDLLKDVGKTDDSIPKRDIDL